jgi:hypothetical protein
MWGGPPPATSHRRAVLAAGAWRPASGGRLRSAPVTTTPAFGLSQYHPALRIILDLARVAAYLGRDVPLPEMQCMSHPLVPRERSERACIVQMLAVHFGASLLVG